MGLESWMDSAQGIHLLQDLEGVFFELEFLDLAACGLGECV